MPSVNPSCFHLSASSIAAFKSCPQKWRLSYREGLRPDKDTDSQRVGTNWHSIHEVYARAITEWSLKVLPPSGDATDYAMSAVIDHLNERYAEVPTWIEARDWQLERQILITSFVGYLWFWQNDPIEFLASEVPFDLPIHAPRTGLPLRMQEVKRVGKIDHVIRWQGMVGSMERKSTTRSIAQDSDYWDKSKKDTQVSMYALAMRDMEASRQLPGGWAAAENGGTFGNTLYDVWHKPTIKPAMLTQKETAEFVKTGEYMEQVFELTHHVVQTDKEAEAERPNTVNGERCEIEEGKKGFAIRETVEMFAARLLQDIYARPDFYFARREIARTDEELRRFRKTLYNVYQAQKTMAATGGYWEDETACRQTYPCSFIPICFGPGADKVCDGTTTPNGFKRIFVDLTVNGKEVEE